MFVGRYFDVRDAVDYVKYALLVSLKAFYDILPETRNMLDRNSDEKQPRNSNT